MRKAFVACLVLSMIALFAYGCDTGGITEESTYVTGALNSKLYYPSGISSPTAATSMSAGYTQGLANVEWLSRDLVDAGYIVLAFTPDNTLGMVSQWKDLHKACISRLQNINSSHSTLRGKISDYQTCGHSKGGGGSLWAAGQLGSTLTTAVGMAPYREGASASVIASITADTFVQAGGGDTLATNSMTRGQYNDLSGSISRLYVEYTGYDHLAWTSTANASRQARIGGDIIAWMKYYIDGNTSYAGTLSNTSGTARHEWVDMGGGSGSSSSSGSSSGCN